jgi:hypothetical protein
MSRRRAGSLVALCVVAGCSGGRPDVRSDHQTESHPPPPHRIDAMPELIGLASADLDCPRESVAWTCPDDVCVEDAWPGDSTTLVHACGHEATYRYQRGRWVMMTLDGVGR